MISRMRKREREREKEREREGEERERVGIGKHVGGFTLFIIKVHKQTKILHV